MTDRLVEYQALVQKIGGAAKALASRAGDAITCHRGCSSCCRSGLSLSPVEAESLRLGLAALPADLRAEIAGRGEDDGSCAMLDRQTGECSVYEARPLVCRTQGLALLNRVEEPGVSGAPPDTIEQVHHCELNFKRRLPLAEETLDADQVNSLLALVNLRFCSVSGEDPHLRLPIATLAAPV